MRFQYQRHDRQEMGRCFCSYRDCSIWRGCSPSIYVGGPQAEVGDIIGCGIADGGQKFFFTFNGNFAGPSKLFIAFEPRLRSLGAYEEESSLLHKLWKSFHPFVILQGGKLRANFGSHPFLYDPSRRLHREKATKIQTFNHDQSTRRKLYERYMIVLRDPRDLIRYHTKLRLARYLRSH